MVKKKNIEQNNKQVHERMEPIPEAGKVSTEETEVTAAFEESKIECEELSEFEIASLQWLQEKEELMDRLKRKQAEMDNLRRISKMEQAEAREYALSEFLCRLLPVLDNLERALEAARGSKEVSDAHAEGLEIIRKQLLQILEQEGVSRIEAIGRAFDPHCHHAVMQVASDRDEPGVVLDELQKGYRFHKRVLRPSMVKVCQD